MRALYKYLTHHPSNPNFPRAIDRRVVIHPVVHPFRPRDFSPETGAGVGVCVRGFRGGVRADFSITDYRTCTTMLCTGIHAFSYVLYSCTGPAGFAALFFDFVCLFVNSYYRCAKWGAGRIRRYRVRKIRHRGDVGLEAIRLPRVYQR